MALPPPTMALPPPSMVLPPPTMALPPLLHKEEPSQPATQSTSSPAHDKEPPFPILEPLNFVKMDKK